MTLDPTLRQAFAPTGVLRAAINLGNPVLTNSNGPQGSAGGVSVDMARELGRRLGVETELVVFDGAAKSVDALANERADVGFFAIDPLRGAQVEFTAPYVLIEGFYLVPEDAPMRTNADVDREGIRVLAAVGSAYALFLARELKQAQLVTVAGAREVIEGFLRGNAEVAAGVKQQLEADMAGKPGLRLLAERFMVIRQAMGMPRSRGEAATRFLAAFVEDMKRSGFVADGLTRHGVQDASVAPAAAG